MPSKAAPKESTTPTPAPAKAAAEGGTQSGQETGSLAADIHAALGLDRTDTEEEQGDADGADEPAGDEDAEIEPAGDDETAEGEDGGTEADAEGADDAEATAADDAGDEAEADEPGADEAGEPESEAGEAHEGEDQDGGKWPKGTPDWAKRQITQLRAELREMKGRQGEPAPAANEPDMSDNPLLEAGNETELASLEERYAGYEEFAEDTLQAMGAEGWEERDETGEPVAKVGGKTFSKAQLEQIRRNAKRVLRQAPRARQFIAARQESGRAAKAAYPWLSDANDPRAVAHAAVKKSAPWLRGVWNADMIVADAITGQQLREAKAKGKAGMKPVAGTSTKPAEKKPAAGTAPPTQTRPAPKPDVRTARATRAAARLEAEGSTDALTELVSSKFEGL